MADLAALLSEDEFLQDALRKVLERQNAPSAAAGMRTPGGALFGGIADVIRAGKASSEQASLGERLKALRGEQKAARQEMLGRSAGLKAPSDLTDPNAWAQGADARESLAREYAAAGDPVLATQGQRLDTDANAYRQNGLQAALARLKAEQEKPAAWQSQVDPITGRVYMFDSRTGPDSVRTFGGPSAKPPAPGQALEGKPTEKQRNTVIETNASMALLRKAIDTLKSNPGAYGGVENVAAGVASSVAGEIGQSFAERRFSKGELSARNFVTNVASEIINKRAGANVSMQEALRQQFLPRDTDSFDSVLQKLNDLMEAEKIGHQAWSGAAPDSGAPPDDAAKLRSKYGVAK